jgi:uncharacterized iron-regulated membrane protein
MSAVTPSTISLLPPPAAHPAQGARRAWARAAAAGALALLGGMAAAGSGDHERARAAVQAGTVLPLPAVLERLQRSHPGQVLEVELERDDGRWTYEVKLLQPDGRLARLVLDARTAEVLSQRVRGRAPGAPGTGTPPPPPPPAPAERR